MFVNERIINFLLMQPAITNKVDTCTNLQLNEPNLDQEDQFNETDPTPQGNRII